MDKKFTQNRGARFWAASALGLTAVINPNLCQFLIFAYFTPRTDTAAIVTGFFLLFLVPFVAYILYVRFGLSRTDYYKLERNKRMFPFAVNIVAVLLFYLFLTPTIGQWSDLNDAAYIDDRLMIFLLFVNAVSLFITLFWRISIHTIALAAFFSTLFFVSAFYSAVWWAACALLLPAVGWARYYLRAHTPMQIIAGGALGLAFPFLFSYVIAFFS